MTSRKENSKKDNDMYLQDEQKLKSVNPNTIFFPSFKAEIDSNYETIIEDLIFQFDVAKAKIFIQDIFQIKIYAVLLEEYYDDLEDIISSLYGYEIVNPNSEDKNIIVRVCDKYHLRKEIEDEDTVRVHIEVEQFKKDSHLEFPAREVRDIVKGKYGGHSEIYNVGDDKLIIHFTGDRKDNGRKEVENLAKGCITDITCTLFEKRFLKATYKGEEDEIKEGDMKYTLKNRLGEDGIRMEIRRQLESILRDFKLEQLNSIYQGEGYDRFYALMLMIFQFPKLYEDNEFVLHIEGCENERKLINGSILINYNSRPEQIKAARQKLQDEFSTQSIRGLSCFCYQPDSQPDPEKTSNESQHKENLFRFAAVFENK